MSIDAPELQPPTMAAGLPGTEPEVEQDDYFGFSRMERFTFPDGKTWIDFKPMNEGEKKDFQDKTSRDLVVERGTGDARMSILQGSERHELLRSSIKAWNLRRGGQDVACDRTQVNDFLRLADPLVIEDLEKAIRKANPWLLGEMSSKDIEKEIGNLTEMLEVAKKREAGEVS